MARPGRLTSAVSGGLALVLVVVVAALAYATQPPSLGVAEFAPTARQELAAPPTTGAEAAAGAVGGRRSPGTTTSTAPLVAPPEPGSVAAGPPTTRVGRSRSCYGDPPRQTEDPMSPTCAATIFEGDNGGSTATGVLGTEIRVAVPIPDLAPDRTKPIDALFEYFNLTFELYGRRLVPVYVPGSNDSALAARARAAEAGAQNVFAAVTGAAERYGAQPALAVELARQEMVTIVRGGSSWWSDRTLYDAYDPYVWSVYPSSEDIQANLGDFACRALARRPATHAGDPGLTSRPRRFGVVALGQVQAPSTTVLADALTSCSDTPPMQQQGLATLRTALERMKADGATTLFCVCEAGLVQNAIDQAHVVGFHPEWVLAPSFWATGNDEEWVQSRRATNALAPPMRVSSGPRLLPLQARPWFGALQAMLTTPGGNFSLTAGMGEFVYPELLMLAAGIQAAGPALDAATFQQALVTSVFPNPGAGQAPYWQPSAGFGPGDHSFYDDYNVAWWSDQAEALDSIAGSRAQGSWCYLDQGARFRPGTYPADAEQQLFNATGPCR